MVHYLGMVLPKTGSNLFSAKQSLNVVTWSQHTANGRKCGRAEMWSHDGREAPTRGASDWDGKSPFSGCLYLRPVKNWGPTVHGNKVSIQISLLLSNCHMDVYSPNLTGLIFTYYLHMVTFWSHEQRSSNAHTSCALYSSIF